MPPLAYQLRVGEAVFVIQCTRREANYATMTVAIVRKSFTDRSAHRFVMVSHLVSPGLDLHGEFSYPIDSEEIALKVDLARCCLVSPSFPIAQDQNQRFPDRVQYHLSEEMIKWFQKWGANYRVAGLFSSGQRGFMGVFQRWQRADDGQKKDLDYMTNVMLALDHFQEKPLVCFRRKLK